MIRDAGVIPGVACHNGDRLRIVDQCGYDCAVFVTPVNKFGFYMNPSKESALDAVKNSNGAPRRQVWTKPNRAWLLGVSAK